MEQNEIITALHAQLKEAAQKIFAGLEIKPGKYNATEADKALNISGRMNEIAMARHESREYPATADRNASRIAGIMSDLETIGITDEVITISCGSFNASMPAALVFAKLAEWEKEFKVKTIDKAVFVKEEEGEAIGTCVVEFPKEAKYIAEYAGTDPVRPVCMGVYLDVKNSCIVATDTRVVTEYPVVISEIEGEPLNLIIDPKTIKAVAGQRCEVKLIKDAEKNISIRTEKGEVYTCQNIKGRFPDYRRVYPKVNRSGLVELTKDGAKALANFAKNTVKQAKDARDGSTCIKIEIPAYSATGTATYYDTYYQGEKSVKFAVKGSPSIDIVFGIHAFHLAMVTKNWNGCFWFNDPSRPIVFDNIKSACTIVMPMQLLDKTAFKCGSCPGVVEALKRHNYDFAESEATAHQQQKEKQIEAESATITRAEKEECAVRYCKIKGVKADIVTDNDEIIAATPNGCRARYVGKFRRSGEIVIFDCEKNFISIPELPKDEPEKPQIPTESDETKEASAEEEKSEETANLPIMYNLDWQTIEDFKKIPNIGKLTASGVFIRGVGYHTEYYRTIEGNAELLARVDNLPYDYDRREIPFQGSGVFGKTELFDNWEDAITATIDALIEHLRQQPPTEPPQDTETDGRHDIPPKPKESVKNVSAAPPEPPKTIHILSGPPGFKFIITPTISKNLILYNHDRNNNLASPHLHNRGLRLPRLPGGSGYNLRHLCVRHPCTSAPCETDRQASRGSPHRPRASDSRMGTKMGKETPFTQIIISHKPP